MLKERRSVWSLLNIKCNYINLDTLQQLLRLRLLRINHITIRDRSSKKWRYPL